MWGKSLLECFAFIAGWMVAQVAGVEKTLLIDSNDISSRGQEGDLIEIDFLSNWEKPQVSAVHPQSTIPNSYQLKESAQAHPPVVTRDFLSWLSSESTPQELQSLSKTYENTLDSSLPHSSTSRILSSKRSRSPASHETLTGESAKAQRVGTGDVAFSNSGKAFESLLFQTTSCDADTSGSNGVRGANQHFLIDTLTRLSNFFLNDVLRHYTKLYNVGDSVDIVSGECSPYSSDLLGRLEKTFEENHKNVAKEILRSSRILFKSLRALTEKNGELRSSETEIYSWILLPRRSENPRSNEKATDKQELSRWKIFSERIALYKEPTLRILRSQVYLEALFTPRMLEATQRVFPDMFEYLASTLDLREKRHTPGNLVRNFGAALAISLEYTKIINRIIPEDGRLDSARLRSREDEAFDFFLKSLQDLIEFDKRMHSTNNKASLDPLGELDPTMESNLTSLRSCTLDQVHSEPFSAVWCLVSLYLQRYRNSLFSQISKRNLILENFKSFINRLAGFINEYVLGGVTS